MGSFRVITQVTAVVVTVGAFGVTAGLAVARSGGPGARASLISSAGSRQVNSPAGLSVRCAAFQVRISVRGGGTGEYRVEFTNVSRAACWLRGYPTVSGHGAAGQTFGVPVAGAVPASVTRVLLPPGASGHADVDTNTVAPRVGFVHSGP
jgi:hypothetical protein